MKGTKVAEEVAEILPEVTGIVQKWINQELHEDVVALVTQRGEAIQIKIKASKQSRKIVGDIRERIRSFFLEVFRQYISPILKKIGWNEFRVSTCPRDASQYEYCWTIRPR